MVHLEQYAFFCCGTLSCGSVCKHDIARGRLFKRSPLRFRFAGTYRLLRNQKSCFVCTEQEYSYKSLPKGGFSALICNTIFLLANNSYTPRCYLKSNPFQHALLFQVTFLVWKASFYLKHLLTYKYIIQIINKTGERNFPLVSPLQTHAPKMAKPTQNASN